jgi:hypothetical protein
MQYMGSNYTGEAHSIALPTKYHGYGSYNTDLETHKTWQDPQFHTCYEDVGEDGELHSAGSCFKRVQNTVLVAIIFCSSITGLCIYSMGRLKMGSFISFVPFPVQCAFLAACGLKIFKCGLGFMVDMKQLKNFQFQTDEGVDTGLLEQLVFNIAPVLGMAGFIMWAEHRFHHSRFGQWVLPVMLFGLTALFYFTLFMYGGVKYDSFSVASFEHALSDARANNNNTFISLPQGRKWLMEDDFRPGGVYKVSTARVRRCNVLMSLS